MNSRKEPSLTHDQERGLIQEEDHRREDDDETSDEGLEVPLREAGDGPAEAQLVDESLGRGGGGCGHLSLITGGGR
jgi:hypothetical protein